MVEEVSDVFEGIWVGIIVIKAIKTGSLSFAMCDEEFQRLFKYFAAKGYEHME